MSTAPQQPQHPLPTPATPPAHRAPAVDRRTFIGLIGAAAASFGLVGLAGCGTASTGGAASGTGDGPQLADTITYGQDADPTALDPAFFDDGESMKVNCNIYEGLYRYAPTDATVEPCLATELPTVSDDGLTYTIKLREGVTFHDGAPFNAQAAKRSIERQLEPARTSGMLYASFIYGSEQSGTGVAKVEAPDDYTLVITLRTPSTPFVKNLAMALGAPIVSPQALDDANDGNITAHPVGTGPYQFISWTKQANVILQAYEGYWDVAHLPKTKNVIFKTIPDASARVQALNTGEVDIIDGIDAANADEVVRNGGVLFAEDGMTVNYMAFNMDSEKTGDVEVRRAIAQAVDTAELVKTIYGDYATPANSIMPLWMAPYDAAVQQTAYDPDAARATLAAKGITELNCITYTNARQFNNKGGQPLAETIQGYLDKVGVKLNVEAYEWATYKEKVNTEPFDVCFYGWTGDNGDPDNFMNLLADTNRNTNVANWHNDEYDALIAKGLALPDGDERNQVYLRCEQIAAEQQPWLLISHSKNLCGLSPKVHDFQFHPTAAVFMKGVTKEK